MVVTVDGTDVASASGQISKLEGLSGRSFAASKDSSSGSIMMSPFGTMLDRMGLGYLILDKHRSIVGWNAEAQVALNIPGEPKDLPRRMASAFRELIADIPCPFAPGTLCWIVIPYLSGRPVAVHEKCDFSPNGESVVFLLARDTKRKPNGVRLQKLFGLSGAETEVALSIACGQTLLQIAESRNLSRTTIRSHLASLFAKTHTKRQSELVNLLTKMSVLP